MVSNDFEQIEDLYEDFHITKLPLMEHEVRGSNQIQKFSRFLTQPFNPDADIPNVMEGN